MDTLQAILLGIVQGITEFLPVSSSGHLQIAKEVLGVELENNITFDVMLHAATVLSTVVVLWRELLQLLQGLFSRHFNEQQAYILKIVISMIPAGVVGVLFAEQIEAFFALLTFAYFAKPRAKKGITYGNAFVIGLAQAAATLPGLSRSGSTIAAGLLLGKSKEEVANFSFIMVIPVILGKMLLDICSGEVTALDIPAGALAGGFLAAFVSGTLACKFMIEVVKRGKLIWFALYCCFAGLVSILFSIF